MGEDAPTHVAPPDDAASDAHVATVSFVGERTRRLRRLEGGDGFGAGSRRLEVVREWLDAFLPKRLELLAPDAQDLIQIFHGVFEPRYAAALPPIFFKYASMSGSRSPSMTRWTSPIFISVRWSLTIVYG